MKRLMLVFATTLLIVAPSSVTQAAPDWFDVEVLAAGMPTEDSLVIQLTDLSGAPAFTGRWFKSNALNVRETYAGALTAISLGLVVLVRVDPDTKDLIFLYVKKDPVP